MVTYFLFPLLPFSFPHPWQLIWRRGKGEMEKGLVSLTFPLSPPFAIDMYKGDRILAQNAIALIN
ncbi:hypothetical protein FDUTEX481_02145 [Tolypothrix sp. PCC 7601]|nr:hypothetical protein FDUTEX481_02145 [Tolypothrix sp. PCC 7601]